LDKPDLDNKKADHFKELGIGSGSISTRKILALLSEAKALNSQGQFNQSLQTLNYCVSQKPDFAEVYLTRAGVYQQQGDYRSALLDLNRAIHLAPQNAEAYVQRGEIYRLAKRNEVALNDLTQAIKLDPGNVVALGRRGTIYRLLHQFNNSINDYNQALALDPANTWVLGNRAETYRALKNYRKAINDYNQVLALNPQLGWVYERRAYPNLWAGYIDEACADFEYSYKLNPANLMNGWMAEWTRMCKKGFSFSLKIEERLRRLEEQDPQHYIAYLCRATLNVIQGDFKQSYKELDTACNLLPEEAGAFFWKGMMAVGLRKDEEAIDLFNIALQLKMPPALLAPVKWLEPFNPVFYQEYGRALLATSPKERNGATDDGDGKPPTRTPAPEQPKKRQDNANSQVAEIPLPTHQAQTSEEDLFEENLLESTLKFSNLKIIKPEEPVSKKPEPETKPKGSQIYPYTNGSNSYDPDSSDEEVTERIKTRPYNSGSPVESPLKEPVDRTAEPSGKAREVSPVESPLEKSHPEKKPTEETVEAIVAESSPGNPGSVSPEKTSEELKKENPGPEILATNLPGQSGPIGQTNESEPVYTTIPDMEPQKSEITPLYEVDKGEAGSTAMPKRGNLLFMALAGAAILIIGLLILVLVLFSNTSNSLSNSQGSNTVAAVSTQGLAPVTATAANQTSPTPGSGSPKPIISQPTNTPVATDDSQARPTAVLGAEKTPDSPGTPVAGVTVTIDLASPTPGATTTQTAQAPFTTQPLSGQIGPVTTASWSNDGRYFATGTQDQAIKVWDAATNKIVLTLTPKDGARAGAPVALSWSNDGHYIVSGWTDRYVRVFTFSPGDGKNSDSGEQELFALSDDVLPQAVTISPDNLLVTYPGTDTVHTQTIAGKAKGPDYSLGKDSQVSAISFSPDKGYLAAGLSDGRVLVWDRATLKLILAILPGQTNGSNPVTALEWSPNDNYLAVGSQKALNVYRVSLTGGARVVNTPISQGLKTPLTALRFSQNSNLVAAGNQDGEMQVWSIDQARVVEQVSLGAGAVLSLNFKEGERQVFVLKGGNSPAFITYNLQQ